MVAAELLFLLIEKASRGFVPPRFVLFCSVGSLANIGVANLALVGSGSWPLAGIVGALMSAVFNFGAASQLVWNGRRRSRRPLVRHG